MDKRTSYDLVPPCQPFWFILWMAYLTLNTFDLLRIQTECSEALSGPANWSRQVRRHDLCAPSDDGVSVLLQQPPLKQAPSSSTSLHSDSWWTAGDGIPGGQIVGKFRGVRTKDESVLRRDQETSPLYITGAMAYLHECGVPSAVVWWARPLLIATFISDRLGHWGLGVGNGTESKKLKDAKELGSKEGQMEVQL